ncbi:electron transport complex subunit RsxG [Thalassotalea maritima]|uniref:electron transport complex subunit RsxG n=1 Tax=Thalassotalea maritima TaxID=3242416 RepID=UPI003529A174
MKLAIQHNAKILALFAVACTAMVSLIYLLTKDTIARQQQLQLLDTLHQVIAPQRLNNDLYLDCQIISDSDLLGSALPQKAYVARWDEQAVAVAMTTVAPNGYNGNIEILVAINIDSSISGVRVLKHNETPGLGDKIELRKDDWILDFDGKTLTDSNQMMWTVKKDGGQFDQFTGATITPRAVVQAVTKAHLFWQQNQQQMLNSPQNCLGADDDRA